MPDCLDLSDTRDRNAGLLACEPLDDMLDRRRVIADGNGALGWTLVGRGKRDDRFPADALDLAACEATIPCGRDRLAVGIDQLELDRRRADIENENVYSMVVGRSLWTQSSAPSRSFPDALCSSDMM